MSQRERTINEIVLHIDHNKRRLGAPTQVPLCPLLAEDLSRLGALVEPYASPWAPESVLAGAHAQVDVEGQRTVKGRLCRWWWLRGGVDRRLALRLA